jgi:hypothetical protein
MNKFYECLDQGKIYEVETLKYLDYDSFSFNDNNAYDIAIIKDDKKTFIEVKSEKLASKTGNICIEYYCRGKPSGISVTKAEYYFIYVVISDVKYRVFKVPTNDIKEMIKNKLFIRECNGGDNMASKMYLFSIKSLLKYELTTSSTL